MCGRYDLQVPKRVIIEQFHLTLYDDPREAFAPNHNVCPAQTMPIITNSEPDRLTFAKWGLVPFWAKDARIGAKMINARAETVAEKPAFKHALARRRCLVPAAAFYEWRKEGARKTPIRFAPASGELFAFAGLWETWKPPGADEPLTTYTIITTTANELVEPAHDRMPVALPEEAQQIWLGTDAEPGDVLPLLVPYPADRMRFDEVAPGTLARQESATLFS